MRIKKNTSKLLALVTLMIFIFSIVAPSFVLATSGDTKTEEDFKPQIEKKVELQSKGREESLKRNDGDILPPPDENIHTNQDDPTLIDTKTGTDIVNGEGSAGGVPQKGPVSSTILLIITSYFIKTTTVLEIILTSLYHSDYDTEVHQKLIDSADIAYHKREGVDPSSENTILLGGLHTASLFSLDKLFFGNVKMLDANVFKTDNNNNASKMTVNEMFKSGLAEWSNVTRYIALMVALITFIIAIIMYIYRASTDGSYAAIAQIKGLLLDVVFGIVIATLFPFLLALILYANDFLMMLLNNIRFKIMESGFENFEYLVFESVFSLNKIGAPASANFIISGISFSVLTLLHLRFAIIFFDRFMTIAFLTLMSPVIAVTFALDRAIDNKSQILSAFLKEYINTVLLEPIYAVLYLLFMISIGSIAVAQPMLGLFILFIFPRMEAMVKQIFGISGLQTVRASKSII